MDKQLILQALNDVDVSEQPVVFIFSELGSTNDWVRDYISREPGKDVLCVANVQTSGRGRAGRVWDSSSANNIYMSFSYSKDVLLKELPSLALVIGLVVARVLSGLNLKASIKWPNDVLVDGSKIAGVLIETRAVQSGIAVIVGIGLNVGMEGAIVSASGIQSTDLVRCGIKLNDINRNALIASLYNESVASIKQFMQKGFESFRQEWLDHDAYLGCHVVIKDQDKILYEGTDEGVDSQGCLLIKTANDLVRVHSGDVSLRLANGC